MENHFKLVAKLHQIDVLRYTPAGVPVLELVLKHESTQIENGLACKVGFELPAKIIGQAATIWQHKQGLMVCVKGFLAQKNQKTSRPVLRIQEIQEYKG